MTNTDYHSVNTRRAPYLDLPAHVQCLPPLPHSLQRLLEIIPDEQASASDLENIIKHDEALSSKVLRIANSAYYGLRGKVGTVSRAIMTVGFHEVQSICLCTLFMEHFPSRTAMDRSERETLWKHSLTTAHFSREIVKGRPWVGREEAYVLGLLHDMGRLVMLLHFTEEYQTIQHLAETGNVQFWEAESQGRLTHTQIGKWISIKWGLPEEYQRVMRYHHFPSSSPSFDAAVQIVCLANLLAHWSECPDLTNSDLALTCCKDLCISDEDWREFTDGAGRALEEVEKLWTCLSH